MSSPVRILPALLFLQIAPSPTAAQATDAFDLVSLARPAVNSLDVLERSANLVVQGVPLPKALSSLGQAADVRLAFSPSDVARTGRVVSCECRHWTVREALDWMLRETGFAFLEFQNQVVVFSGSSPYPSPALPAPPVARLAAVTITAATVGGSSSERLRGRIVEGTIVGRVVEMATQRPLTGAQVFIPATGQGTLTNPEGRFVLSGVPDGPATIHVQMIGFQTGQQSVTVQPGGTSTANFELATEALALDEVVVTGTAGQARRREIGNSVSAVRSTELQVQPIMTAQDAITAQVPGIVLQGNEGVPGAGPSIRVRGITSMTQGNAPLIYVDGVRIRSSNFPGSAQGQSAHPLNSVNPDDIERIEVIKGAAATTLYGTEASSGVIQIFTKRGSEAGSAIWEASVTQGFSRSPRIGPEEDDAWFEQWGENAGQLFMEQYLQTGHTQDYNLSVRGSAGDGSNRVSYYLSGGWSDETAVIPKNASSSATIRGNVGFTPFENVNIQFNSSFSNRHIVWVPGGNLAKGFTLNVMRGPFDYTADADTVFFTEFDVIEDIRQFTSGLEINFSPSESFASRIALGIDNADNDYRRTEFFGSLLEPPGYRQARRFTSINRTLDVQSTYSRGFGGIRTSTSAGFQVFSSSSATVTGTSQNFSGPGNPTLNTGSQQSNSENRLDEVNAGFFVQELIGIADRFFVTLGARMDGNSAFGRDYGLQFYPKISASYVVSDEAFWPTSLGTAKLRMAYGESGKAPGYFDSQRTWTPTAALESQPAVSPRSKGNPELGPERSQELEAGIEITALEGRVTVDASVYSQTTADALLNVPQDPTLGFTGSQIDNVGTIENRGFELNLTGVLVSGADISWEMGLGAAGNRSEMADLGGTADVSLGGSLSPGMWVRQGYPVPAYFGNVLLNPDEVGADPVVEEQYLGPIYPTHSFILSSTFRLGRLTATARGEYQGGHVNVSHTAWRNAQRGVWPPCLSVWQQYNADPSGLTAGEVFRCGAFDADWAAYLSPADHFRLSSVSVSYSMPGEWTGGFGDWTVSLGARNLFLLTDYIGLDPGLTQGGEGLSRHEYYQLPLPRTFSFTVRSTF